MDFGFGSFNEVNEKEELSVSLNSNQESGGFGSFGSSFADGFGGGFSDNSMSADDFFMSPKEAREKRKAEEKKAAEEKKKAEAAAKISASKKPVNDCEVKFPVMVYGRNICHSLEGEGTKKVSEIRKELVELGYKQFLIPEMGLLYHELSNILYVVDNSVMKEYDTDILVNIENGLTVADGMLQAEFTMENFEGKEADEISVKDIINKWVSINPMYEGCGMAYNEECNIMYPVMKSLSQKEYAEKINVFDSYVRLGNKENVDEEKTYEEVIKEVGNLLSDYKTDKVKVELQYSGGSTFFVSYMSSDACKESVSVNSSKKDKKKVEKKYNLPLNLFVVTWGASYPLTKDMFDGKEKVTIGDIKEVMKQKERMFADSSRKIDTYYDEANNKLSVMFVSGTKGCELIHTREELEEIKKKDCFDGNFCDSKEAFRIRVLPIGNFYSFRGLGRDFYKYVSIDFERKLPKIPFCILKDIVNVFRKDLTKEAAVRIFYNRKENTYSYSVAKGCFTKISAHYEFEADMDQLTGNKILVMEIHSHNTMDAYFSGTDNNDESLYPGLFGVVGNLDYEMPSFKFRAGCDGLFKNLELTDIFETRV